MELVCTDCQTRIFGINATDLAEAGGFLYCEDCSTGMLLPFPVVVLYRKTKRHNWLYIGMAKEVTDLTRQVRHLRLDALGWQIGVMADPLGGQGGVITPSYPASALVVLLDNREETKRSEH